MRGEMKFYGGVCPLSEVEVECRGECGGGQ